MKKLVINKNEIGVFIFFFLISFSKGIGLNNSNKVYLRSIFNRNYIGNYKIMEYWIKKKKFFIGEYYNNWNFRLCIGKKQQYYLLYMF